MKGVLLRVLGYEHEEHGRTRTPKLYVHATPIFNSIQGEAFKEAHGGTSLFAFVTTHSEKCHGPHGSTQGNFLPIKYTRCCEISFLIQTFCVHVTASVGFVQKS
eukprot:scaffold31532_cov78-Skeletonema_dohrnii-CCMP3373.AAC.2